jgi:ATP phosphoribosyltransferase
MRITLSLPDELARRFLAAVPDRKRSALVARLLAAELQRYERRIESSMFRTLNELRRVHDQAQKARQEVLETRARVEMISDLVYSKASTRKACWVLAVPSGSPIARLEDCAGRRISTELVEFTRRYFQERGIPVEVEFSWGATEAKVVEGLVDAIVEVTETGSTIRAHGLKIIHTLLESNTKLIANPASYADPWKKAKIRQLALLLQGALNADSMVGLKMNVPEEKLEEVVAILPCITAPTIAQLYKSPWFSVEVMVSEAVVREIIPRLIERGADGIIEYSLNKLVGAADRIQ